MKEILISEGFKRNGGCNCNGGADFYMHDSFPFYKIEHYYKANYILLKYRNRQIRKGLLNEIESIIQQVKDPIPKQASLV